MVGSLTNSYVLNRFKKWCSATRERCKFECSIINERKYSKEDFESDYDFIIFVSPSYRVFWLDSSFNCLIQATTGISNATLSLFIILGVSAHQGQPNLCSLSYGASLIIFPGHLCIGLDIALFFRQRSDIRRFCYDRMSKT